MGLDAWNNKVAFIALRYNEKQWSAFVQVPFELQKHILTFASLKEIRGLTYGKGDVCVGLIGLDNQNYKVAFVTLRYDGDRWTPFAGVPFDQENNYFSVVSEGGKTVALQSYRDIDGKHTNTSGHHVELNPQTHTVILRPIELGSFSRMGTVEFENGISF